MNQPHRVTCLDAKYDETSGQLVVLLMLLDMNYEKRIVYIPRDLHNQKRRSIEEMDMEMRRTEKMFKKLKGKEFNWVLNDDPNREKISEKDQMYYATLFNKKISDELTNVSEGLYSDKNILYRKLRDLANEGKINFDQLNEIHEKWRK